MLSAAFLRLLHLDPRFFMLSMTALLLSESVMLLHIRIQW